MSSVLQGVARRRTRQVRGAAPRKGGGTGEAGRWRVGRRVRSRDARDADAIKNGSNLGSLPNPRVMEGGMCD